eukprot:scaffold4976_cov131-Isochrysis_galbana.AAC.1
MRALCLLASPFAQALGCSPLDLQPKKNLVSASAHEQPLTPQRMHHQRKKRIAEDPRPSHSSERGEGAAGRVPEEEDSRASPSPSGVGQEAALEGRSRKKQKGERDRRAGRNARPGTTQRKPKAQEARGTSDLLRRGRRSVARQGKCRTSTGPTTTDESAPPKRQPFQRCPASHTGVRVSRYRDPSVSVSARSRPSAQRSSIMRTIAHRSADHRCHAL